MIYDVFLFHGEVDILDIRFNVLNKVVDKFVVCEAMQSFNGEPNPSYYQQNLERFKQFDNKVINYQFNIFEDEALVKQARESPNTEYGNPFWMKVYYAMETLRKPLVDCKDDDLIFISDVDEIWNPDIGLPSDDRVYEFEQANYYYQLNNRCSENWIGSIVTTGKKLKQVLVNNIKQRGEVRIQNGGWHFTYQGDEEEVKRKIRCSQPAYYGIPPEEVLSKVKSGKDFFEGKFGRNYTFTTDESDLPQYLKDNKEKYKSMFK